MENKRRQKEEERKNPFCNPNIDRRPENKPESDSEIGTSECFPQNQKTSKIKSAMKKAMTDSSEKMKTPKSEQKTVVFGQKPIPSQKP